MIFSNLLQREGYASLEEVRAEQEAQTLRDAIVAVLTARRLSVDDKLRSFLYRAQDPTILRSALRLAATAAEPGEIVTALGSSA